MATRTDMLQGLFTELSVEDGFNVRYDYGDIQELSNSIVENGVREPIHVYQVKGDINRFTIIDGHRRYKAIELGIQQGKIDPAQFKIPMMKEKIVSDENRALGLIIYNGGKSLTLLEEATVYERFINWGWKAVDIAKKIGKSQAHISNALILLKSNLGIRKMIIDKQVSPSLVISLLKDKESAEVEKELKTAIANKTALHKVTTEDDLVDTSHITNKGDNTDIPAKKDNAKTSGKDTRTLPEAKSGQAKVTKRDIEKDVPKSKTIKLDLIKDLEQEIAADENADDLKLQALKSLISFLDGYIDITALKEQFLFKVDI